MSTKRGACSFAARSRLARQHHRARRRSSAFLVAQQLEAGESRRQLARLEQEGRTGRPFGVRTPCLEKGVDQQQAAWSQCPRQSREKRAIEEIYLDDQVEGISCEGPSFHVRLQRQKLVVGGGVIRA